MKNMISMRELIQQLNKASEAYYKYDNPIMSDKQYDELYDKLCDMEQETGIVLAGSPTQEVQGYILKGFNKVEHSKPMLSADKTKDVNEIKKFLGNYEWYCSGKLDGCTLVVLYSNGEFIQGITRGNGVIGEDVTEACRFITNLPMKIPYKDNLELRGECVMDWEEFNRINELLSNKYAHPRNLASGTLRQLDLNIVKERKLSFVVFECITDIINSKSEELNWLKDIGFETVIKTKKYINTSQLSNVVEMATNSVQNDKYPYDGLIFELDNKEISKSLGKTAHHESCRMALKWADTTYETQLLDIEWNPGKSGVLFPTGIVEPVDLDGAITSRVTLHNLSYIKDLELGIGDTVTLYRSNMVIPAIDDNLTRSNNLDIPQICPVCGEKTEVIKQNESEVLYCTNPNCAGKLLGKLSHFASKQGLDIDGLSEKTLEDLINLGMVSNFEDIFNLADHADRLKKIPGYGKKSVDNLLAAIEKSKNCDLQHFISSLSIPGIGIAQSKELVKAFPTWTEFYEAATSGYDFTKIDGVGNVLSYNIKHYFKDNNGINDLASYIHFASSTSVQSTGTNSKLDGKTFVITGKVFRFPNRDAVKDKIESYGGKVASSVSKNTDYLINNDSASSSSKNLKAKQLGVKIITEDEFVNMLGGE